MQSTLLGICYFIIFIGIVLPVTTAQSHVGVAQTVVDLGELDRGTDNIATFFLVTSTSKSFLVSLNKEPANIDFFSRRGYENHLYNHSEEDVMGWVELFSNSVEVEPLSEGGTGLIGAQKEVKFILNIPEDAESGYHIFRIKPLPVFPSGDVGGPVGAMVVSVTTVTFLFNIEGKAIRDGIILDVVPEEITNGRFITGTYFQNTGTTTITAVASQRIHKNGELVAESSSSKTLVNPGEIKVLKTPFSANNFSEGYYDVSTSVNFLSDSVSKNSTILVSAALPPPVEEKPNLLWLLIIVVVIFIIAIIIYKIS